jgi:hypothetical protein
MPRLSALFALACILLVSGCGSESPGPTAPSVDSQPHPTQSTSGSHEEEGRGQSGSAGG